MTEVTEAPTASGQVALPASPTIRLFLERHPALREASMAVLSAARRVRQVRARAIGREGYPQPEHPREHTARRQALVASADALCIVLEGGTVDPRAPVDDLVLAIAELRACSHSFSAQRQPTSPEARAALFEALREHARVWAALEQAAESRQIRSLPWQLELATHVEPDTPVTELTLTGYDLPGVPALRRSWGERCCVCGRQYLTDSHTTPEPRYRSLDACHSTLCPDCHTPLRRAREALERARTTSPAAAEAAGRLARAYPFVFDHFTEENAHQTFVKLPLLDFPSLAVSLNNALLAYRHRPLFGDHQGDGAMPGLGVADRVAIAAQGAVSGYRWLTFEQVRGRTLALARELEARAPGEHARVGVLMARNRAEFYLADFATVFADKVSVGLQYALSDEQLAGAARQAGVEAMVVDRTSLERVLAPAFLLACPSLRCVIAFDLEGAAPAASAGPIVIDGDRVVRQVPPPSWRSASGIGIDTPAIHGDLVGHRRALDLGIAPETNDQLYTIVFTSGSTGAPKGTPMTRRRWIEEMIAETNAWPYVVASFQPSAYGADRAQVWTATCNGGRVGFARRGESLFQDLRALRPTALDVPPVVWNTIYSEYKRAVADPSISRSAAAAVRKRFRESLGGRLAMISTGGAPSDSGVRRTMEEIFGVPMHEGYGTTETGYIARSGVVRANVEVRLVDRLDLGYTRADRPHPRGELAVKTPNTTARYFNDDDNTRDAFTEDGFFLTGDLVEMLPGGELRVLGRRKQVFKLAGAEFVSPELLERHYQTSDLVEAIFVTGSAVRSQVTAVVVPSRPDLEATEILRDLRAIARREGLRACDVPVGVVVEPRTGPSLPWTVANGLLTSSFKLNRRALSERYTEAIERTYRDAESALASDDTGDDGSSASSTLDRLGRLVAAILAVDSAEIDVDRSFLDHGGDSLGSMELMLRLEHVFAGKGEGERRWEAAEVVRMPLRALARHLATDERGDAPAHSTVPPPAAAPQDPATERRPPDDPPRTEPAALPTAAEIHRRMEADSRSVELPDPLPAPSTAAGVLLTGGTGFLGVHLLAHLAATLPAGRKLYALVRAADHEGARERLRRALGAAGLMEPEISVPGSDGPGALVAIAGDLERPSFGVDTALWRRLETEVGLIYHVAARVSDHAGYPELRDANVVATRNVLELATRTGLKALHFVSSLNVAHLLQQAGRGAAETAPLGDSVPEPVIELAAGYALSKWVGERMVQDVAARCGPSWRVSISRPAMITWASQTGFANATDWLTRILDSCLELDAVPFPDEVGTPRWMPETPISARGVDMVPVDFTAAAVAAIGRLTETAGSRQGKAAPVLHVSNRNPAETGFVTMARLMDLLAAAVCRNSRKGERSRRALAALPLGEWMLRAEIERAMVLPLLEKLSRSLPAYEPTQAAVFASLAERLGVSCPPIGVDLVERYVDRTRRDPRP